VFHFNGPTMWPMSRAECLPDAKTTNNNKTKVGKTFGFSISLASQCRVSQSCVLYKFRVQQWQFGAFWLSFNSDIVCQENVFRSLGLVYHNFVPVS